MARRAGDYGYGAERRPGVAPAAPGATDARTRSPRTRESAALLAEIERLRRRLAELEARVTALEGP